MCHLIIFTNYILEFLMKRNSICVEEAGIPLPKTHIIGREAAKILAATAT